MKARFIHEGISVEFAHKPGPPVAFTWRGEVYKVTQVRRAWFDYGWGPLRPGAGRWWQRRHRTYYVVDTDRGGCYEIYLDRGRGSWVLLKELVPE